VRRRPTRMATHAVHKASMRLRALDVRRIGRTALVLTTACSLVLACFSGPAAGWSMAAGGVLAIGNLHLIRATVSRLIARTRRTAQGVGLVALKMGLMIAFIAGAFQRLPLEPGPVAAGVSMLLVAVMLDACVLGTPLPQS
jgi:hypothetical protein